MGKMGYVMGGRDGVTHEGKVEESNFWWRVTSNKKVSFKILGMSGESPILIPHKYT